MVARRRLDAELVRRGLAASRRQAGELITQGGVLVGGAPTTNKARLVHPGEAITLVAEPPRFVSRGGEKLAAALRAFGIEPHGRRALDVGASTGGFTDCLLQAGAAEVVALDVGHGQLHERLRADPRVTAVERTNVREVEPGALGPLFDLVVVDVSFISLTVVLPVILRQLRPGGELVALVKPQFEAGRREAARGRGVIRDPQIWSRTLQGVIVTVTDTGATIMGCMASPIRGAEGNVEFLVAARRDPAAPRLSDADLLRLVAAAIEPVTDDG